MNTTNTTTAPPTTSKPVKDDNVADRMISVPSFADISYIDNGVLNEVTDLKMEQAIKSTYEIENASEKDTAIYTCLIINPKGLDRKTTKLTVKPSEFIWFLFSVV